MPTSGVTRVWDMTSPIARIPLNNNMYTSHVFVTPDWKWLVNHKGKEFWPLRTADRDLSALLGTVAAFESGAAPIISAALESSV